MFSVEKEGYRDVFLEQTFTFDRDKDGGSVKAGIKTEEEGMKIGMSGSGEGGEKEAEEAPKRIFLEFYGPIVGIFLAMGLSARTSELLTVLAAQACPLLAAAPLLRLSLASGVGRTEISGLGTVGEGKVLLYR